MAQADLNIVNQSGAAFRADLNNQLLALGTLQSGNSPPSTTYQGMLWLDTSTSPSTLKQRNDANNGWVTLGILATNLGHAPAANPSFTGTADFAGDVNLNGTGYIDIPTGTTAQRPGTPSSGMIRFNSSLSQFEGYNGSAWGQLGGGATGAGGDTVFFENSQTVTTNYTLTTGKNAVTAGPVTVNSGVTVTVPSGASWVIV